MSTLFLRHPGEADLALFAGGELGPLARWRIEGHLNGCAGCRQVVSEFFELRSRVMDLAELPQVDWADLTVRIRGSAESLRQQRPSWSLRRLIFAPSWRPALALLVLLAAGGYVSLRHYAPAMAGGDAVSLDASARSVELRVGNDQVLTLVNATQNPIQVNWRVSADAVSARYFDKDTGNITVNNVYTE